MSYDLTIIGGGITGASVAYDAQGRGLSVALFEQNDFGSGASTATSKLIHGGLRYLENYQLGLVFESLKERRRLLKLAGHVVKGLRFYIPLFKQSRWKAWQLRLGLSSYDLMSMADSLPAHSKIFSIKDEIPWLNHYDIQHVYAYSDAQMQDNRLLVEVLKMAEDRGAVLHNYQPVLDIKSINLGYQLELKHKQSIYSQSVISCVGAWSNSLLQTPRVSPTKGVHIVLPNMGLKVALLLFSPIDQRVFFVMPWEGLTLIGTTDTAAEPGLPHKASSEDISYLLTSFNAYYQGADWRPEDVISTFCGYRPLIYSPQSTESGRSRELQVQLESPGFWSITGGKYGGGRKMAQIGVDHLIKDQFKDRVLSKCQTHKQPYKGFFEAPLPVEGWATRYGITLATCQGLVHRYGAMTPSVLACIPRVQGLAIEIGLPKSLLAELYYSITEEWAKVPDDFLFRRSYIGHIYANDQEKIRAIKSAFEAIMFKVGKVSF